MIWRDQKQETYNRIGAAYPKFMSAEQVARAERIRQARLLFGNRHREYYLEESRTQHKFPTIETDGVQSRPYFMVNVLRLISLKTADLLFGQEPLIRVENEIQQQKLSALGERTALHPLIMKAAVSCTYAGETFMEARVFNGQVYVSRIKPMDIFPVGQQLPSNEYASYVRYSFQVVAQGESQRRFLMETTYLPGAILRKAFELDSKGEKVAPIDLKSTLGGKLIFDKGDGTPFDQEVKTGIAANTVVYVPNFQDDDDDCPVSSYDGVIHLQDNLNAVETQINRILEQHADPAMYADEQQADSRGRMRSRKRVFWKRQGEDPPGYIVRDLQLDAVQKKSELTLRRICILAEMSPSVLGLTDGAAAESWKKYKLSATNALSMAQRKASVWRPALRKLMGICQELENTIPGERYDRGPVACEMRDGIPQDDLDVADYISTLRGANLLSDERAVSLMIPDQAAQRKELERLQAQRDRATPSVFRTTTEDPLPSDETEEEEEV